MGLAELASRRSRAEKVVVFGAMVLALVNAAVITPASQIIDDAFVFFRYADNFLAGHGLTWNDGGEHVEGYTSFLYLAVVTVLRALGLEPVFATHVLNVTLYVLLVGSSVWLVGQLEDSGHEQRRWYGRASIVLAPVLLGVHTYFAQMARGGMEQMLFLLLLSGSLIAFLRASVRPIAFAASGALFALVILTRPEAIIDYVACVAWASVLRRRTLRHLLTTEGWRLAGFLALLVPHLVWRHAYYGDWLPNTFYAKVHVESWAQLRRGLVACFLFFASSRGALVQMAAVSWLLVRRTRARDLMIVLMAVWIFYLLSLGLQDWSYYYSVPVDFFALVVLGSSLGVLVDRGFEAVAPWRMWVLRVALALMTLEATYLYLHGSVYRVVLIGVAVLPLLLFRERRWVVPALVLMAVVDSAWWQEPHQRYDVMWNNVAIGHKLKEIARPGDTLAIGAAGAIPYYSGLVTFDTLGLNDRHIARVPVKDPARLGFGHERGDGAYILGKKPTYLVPTPLRSMVSGPAPWWAWVDESFVEIFASDTFERDYQFEEVELPGGGYFKFYERKR
jgi:hypothetical protein